MWSHTSLHVYVHTQTAHICLFLYCLLCCLPPCTYDVMNRVVAIGHFRSWHPFIHITYNTLPVCNICCSNWSSLLFTSLLFAEIVPAVFNEDNEEERLDNLFEVGEGFAPTAVTINAESVVLSLARKCLKYHVNVEWGMCLHCTVRVSPLL